MVQGPATTGTNVVVVTTTTATTITRLTATTTILTTATITMVCAVHSNIYSRLYILRNIYSGVLDISSL